MNIDRMKAFFILIGAIQSVFMAGCDNGDNRRLMTIQYQLNQAGFVEIPSGFQISEFTVPPCDVVFPMVAKHPTIWILENMSARVEMIPVRSENGEYSLILQSSSRTSKRLATLTGKDGATEVFLSEDGTVVKMDDHWVCALFFMRSNEGLVAWKVRNGGFHRVIHSKSASCNATVDLNGGDATVAPPCYRRFVIKGKSDTSGPGLLHEVWPVKKSSSEKRDFPFPSQPAVVIYYLIVKESHA